jgi:tetratricopeptide (TPR) repeat protein
MARYPGIVFVFSVLVIACATAQIPSPANGQPQGTPPAVPAQKPDPPPLPPDVKSPDAPPGSVSSGNPVTRTLKKLAPNCINAVFHACWSSPPEKPQPPPTDERKATASREVGELYYSRGNYRAAESRFREALELNPKDARDAFELGQSLEALNRIPEALQEYHACQQIQIDGPYAERSQKAINRLTSQANGSSKN